jgi:hypothetical protein
MAFIVEDGTGVADANSYADTASADSYFADRGNVAWAGVGDAAVKQRALVQATDYIETIFKRRFAGDKASTTQGLSWPRLNTGDHLEVAFADDEIPLSLTRACFEYAVRSLAAPLLPDPAVDASGFTVVTTKKVVGPLEKEFQVMGTSSQGRQVRAYPAADALMRDLLRPSDAGRVTR